ncbi:hypothetical protein ACKXMY_001431 [Neisseria gonorrhoeae]|nr:hypothetical protein [Neisseria gonorrhoeae]MDO6002038.1 hypothetical protein [Neisseria gonorrhoeae]MDO6059503.1 hypothetical protein [Neisseria gonorrhoeae]MDO6063488.1 hypothetical protein [Neisseria gonorrhoeae]MDO6070805.1 hypothetical protein [Neisseria gonorrhoeae]MDO6079115.1 hypothetical protein [Neisseria gonorrhoeae]
MPSETCFFPSRSIAISETKAGGIMSSNTTHRYTFCLFPFLQFI